MDETGYQDIVFENAIIALENSDRFPYWYIEQQPIFQAKFSRKKIPNQYGSGYKSHRSMGQGGSNIVS
jgi:hypothetical protein